MRAALDAALRLAAMVLLVALLGVVTLGVVTRGAGEPLIWTDELSRFLMVWLAVLGWLLATRKRAHIRIRFFVDMLPARPRRLVEAVLQAAMAGFGLLTAWFALPLVARNFDVDATALPVPMAVMYLPIVLAGLVTAVQAGAEFVEALR